MAGRDQAVEDLRAVNGDDTMTRTDSDASGQMLQELQAQNLRHSAEIYRQTLKTVHPTLLACAGFVIGAVIMAALIVGFGWL